MQLGVNVRTLSNWEKKGKIQAIKTPSGQRRYDIESYAASKKEITYVRVTSEAQKLGFKRKIVDLIVSYPNIEVISKIGKNDEIIAEYRIQIICNRDNYGSTQS